MSFRDRLLDRERRLGRPLRLGLVGAGQMGRGFAAQLGRMPGVHLSAVADVEPARAAEALTSAGVGQVTATTSTGRARAVDDGASVVLDDAGELVELPLDVVIEATGVPEIGARVILSALLAGRDVATLNVECDVTVGALLHRLSASTGSVYSVCRGDEPVEAKILVDFARDLGFEVVAAGKGKNNPLDPRATPASLLAEATQKRMNPKMLCSFVDGSKAMIEMAALANTTGLEVSRRGMHGPPSTVDTLHRTFALQDDGGVLDRPGVVDYCTGPVAPGVFAVVRADDPYVNHEMSYLKMGDGPYFSLYRPYHLASIEAPLTVYEMALDRRPSLVAEHWTAEVAAATKRDLVPGDVIDGVGGSTVAGVIDDAEDFRRDRLVPLGVLAGARVVRPVAAGELLTVDDVEVDTTSVIVALRQLQDSLVASAPTSASLRRLLGVA
ncbi:MAG TPA: SAF domain-containing protein [Mycobacteriales bacterium]|jgi:predicted homoserine dehydrogenase-like protein|nr:SAF domain-containing protein [Mycobacteriales bacterium]